MIKSTNLFSLTSLESVSMTQKYIGYLSTDARNDEIEIMQALCNRLRDYDVPVAAVNNFYIGFSIPQISKEFDLLQIGSTIINIELKTKFTDKVLRQLQRNRYYLRFLGKPLELFTYCAQENQLYCLKGDNDTLTEVNFDNLIDAFAGQKDYFDGDIAGLFNPSDYLVSPFNSTEKFLSEEYFLTSQQEHITNQALDAYEAQKFTAIAIKGVAGTGKSLLLYHIAYQLIKRQQKILIIHSGRLNDGHQKLREQGFSIEPIKNVYHMLEYTPDFKAIFIDESQRMNGFQVNAIFRYARENNVLCLFFYDQDQTLNDTELKTNMADRLNKYSHLHFELTDKIRTNKELADFLNVVLGKKHDRISPGKNVNVLYFKEYEEAASYIGYMATTGWSYISHTPSIPSYRIPTKYDALLDINEIGSAHSVIGQEFDKVIAVIDETFFYDERGLLASYDLPNNPYLRRNMFFQAITRVRQKIEIVVVNNIKVYEKIIDALTLSV